MLLALPFPSEIFHPFLGASPRAAQVFYGVLGGLALLLLLVLWLVLGSGPRRRRKYHQARRLLQQGAWQDALKLACAMQQGRRLSARWQGQLQNLEGECHRAASRAALEAKDYEAGLDHSLAAARLLNTK